MLLEYSGLTMEHKPISLEDLVPHRGRMLLLSEVVSYDDKQATASAIVSEHWPMTTERGANALVLIELVAQTAAINNGWQIIQRQGPEKDHRGWIVGIKSAQFFVDSIAVGTTIIVESRNQFEYENFRVTHGVARIGNQIGAEVTLQLIQAE